MKKITIPLFIVGVSMIFCNAKKINRPVDIRRSASHIIIEINGQSNAVGAALISTLPSDLSFIPNAFIYSPQTIGFESLTPNGNNSGVFGLTGDGSSDARTGKFGVELRLMKLLSDYYRDSVFLIKAAMSNSSLHSDPHTDWSETSINENYQSSNNNHNSAIAITGGELKAYIWIQGENDANLNYAGSYQTNLYNFLSAKRIAYGQSNLPILIVRMGNNQTAYGSYLTTIRSAQENIALQKDNFLVDADGAEVQGDNTHYSAVGYDTIANRIYRKILEIYPTIRFRGHKAVLQ